MNSQLFTELTISEEAILSGGSNTSKANKGIINTTNPTRSNGVVTGASGGTASGGSVGAGSSSSATGAEGVYISN